LQLPARQAVRGGLTAAGGLGTLGAARRRLLGGAGLGVAADVAFEEPGRQVVAEQARAGLALEEGDEVVLLGVGEHAFEGVVGGGEPLLPQLFPVRAGRRSRGSHGGVAPGVEMVRGELRILPWYHTGQRAAAELQGAAYLPGAVNCFSISGLERKPVASQQPCFWRS